MRRPQVLNFLAIQRESHLQWEYMNFSKSVNCKGNVKLNCLTSIKQGKCTHQEDGFLFVKESQGICVDALKVALECPSLSSDVSNEELDQVPVEDKVAVVALKNRISRCGVNKRRPSGVGQIKDVPRVDCLLRPPLHGYMTGHQIERPELKQVRIVEITSKDRT